MEIKHLQSDKPILEWDDWLGILASKYADSLKIDKVSALRYINLDQAREWYDDGFSPLVCFRENM